VIRRNLVVPGPGEVLVVEEELPSVREGGLLLQTLATGLSAGTELTFVKGDHPALSEQHDPELGLFLPHPPKSPYPVERLGYMEVAQVAESRTEAFSVGDVVATAYGHATAHVSDPVREHLVPLPADVSPLLGVYVAHVGPICANGLLHAAADTVGPGTTSLADGVSGHRVAVVGAGLIGLLTAMFARFHGAEEVVLIEEDESRRTRSEALGFEALHGPDPALVLKTRWRHGPADHGADVVFQCRGRARCLAMALRTVRPQGTVVDLAFYTESADAVMLGQEFHHNGLSLRSAQIGRTPRGTAPYWDRQRLSAATVHLLRAHGAEIRKHLISDVVPFDEAPQLLLDLAERRRQTVSAVFDVAMPR
jgi:threonine dehydrogenase-like Zn-dependent dehydrogenase